MQQSHQPSRGSLWRRLFVGIAAAVLLLAAAGYLAVGYVAADRLTIPRRNFDVKVAPRQPAVPFQDVRFPARTDGVPIAGTYIPRDGATRAIVMVHGKDNNRKQEFFAKWPDLATDLERAGFAVLMIDLRGHGESGDGRFTFGLIERRDVLGALDWLHQRGITQVDVLGVSFGAVVTVRGFASVFNLDGGANIAGQSSADVDGVINFEAAGTDAGPTRPDREVRRACIACKYGTRLWLVS